MKNKSLLTRTLALLLVLLMCLPMAVACDDESEKDPVDSTAANDETTASAEETTAGEEETTEEDDSDKVPLRVMSFNVQASVTVAERYETVKYHIQSYAPDLLGMQEDLGDSWADENNFKLEGYTVFGNCDTIKPLSVLEHMEIDLFTAFLCRRNQHCLFDSLGNIRYFGAVCRKEYCRNLQYAYCP